MAWINSARSRHGLLHALGTADVEYPQFGVCVVGSVGKANMIGDTAS